MYGKGYKKYSKKSSKRRSFRKKKGPTLRSLAKKVRKIQDDEELKEWKAYYYSQTGTIATASLRANNPFRSIALNTPIRAVASDSRIADEIRCTSVHISGVCYVVGGGATLGNYNKVRIIVFWDKDAKGSAPYLNGTVASAGLKQPLFLTSGTSVCYPWTQYNTQESCFEQYKVIYDHVYTNATLVGAYKSTDVGNSVNPEIMFDIKLKLHRTTDLGRGTAGTLADCELNALYVAFITDCPDDMEVDMDTKLYFKDA